MVPTRRLLLVENYAPLAEATAALARDVGLEVQIAESGEKALQMSVQFRPEIVLCDLGLPDISGLDVANRLRAIPDAKNALFAICTAMSETDVRALATAIDKDVVNVFLSKPMTRAKLAALMATLNG